MHFMSFHALSTSIELAGSCQFVAACTPMCYLTRDYTFSAKKTRNPP